MPVLSLMTERGAVGKGEWRGALESPDTLGTYSFQVGLESTNTSASPASATVNIYGANNQKFPVLIMTITLTGAYNGNPVSDADRDNFPWAYYMAEVTSITGNGRVSVDVRI